MAKQARGLDRRVTLSRKKTYNTKSNIFKYVKTPGGRLVVHIQKKKVKAPSTPAHLGGAPVRGLKRVRSAQWKNLPKSQRTITRAYGGVLNHDQVKEKIIRAFLMEEKKVVKQVMKIKAQKEKDEKK
ncbi:hypothetical protein ABK040_011612 [Willaertia magna]